MGRFFSPGVPEANPVAATLRRTFLATNPRGYAAPTSQAAPSPSTRSTKW